MLSNFEYVQPKTLAEAVKRVAGGDVYYTPLVRNPRAVIVLNLPSLDKYEPQVVSGGVLVANASLINRAPQRSDLVSVLIPANEIAEQIGDRRLLNMVTLGAMLALLPVLPLQAIKKSLEAHLPERHRRLLPVNYDALDRGAEFALSQARQPVV